MAARKKAAKPAAKKPAKVTDDKVVARNEQLNRTTVELIKSTAPGVHKKIGAHKKPELSFPVRSLGQREVRPEARLLRDRQRARRRAR